MNEDRQWNFIDRIKKFLKEFMFTDIYDEYIKIDNLLKNIENKQEFNFDKALFISLYLNDNYENILEKLSLEKLKYLYLLTLYENIPLNTLTNKKFIAFANNKDFAKEALLDLFRYYQLYDILKDDLENTKTDLLKIVERSFYRLNQKNLIDSFLREFHLKLSNDTLNKLKNKCSTKLLEIIIKLKNKNLLKENELIYFFKEIFDLRNNYRFFTELSFEDRVFLSFNFINIFDDSDKLTFVNGFQSDYQLTASFVSTNLLKLLTKKEMEELVDKDISNYWKRILKSNIYRIDSKEKNENKTLEVLRDFIKEKAFMNEYDFFNFIIDEINELKNRIEMNEDNEKNLFYNNDATHKKEEDCRDAVVNLLDKTKYVIIREKCIGDNRTDFECYDKSKDYKVRVECKNDGYANSVKKLASGVHEQLIKKYLKNKSTEYGIYLIFYFKDSNKNIKELYTEIRKNIPKEWEDKVEVIILDLRK